VRTFSFYFGKFRKHFTIVLDASVLRSFNYSKVGFYALLRSSVADTLGECTRLARIFESEVARGLREENPLHRFTSMKRENIASELAKPGNTPLVVAAITAYNVHLLNGHKHDLKVAPEALGYQFNADCAYAKTDKAHTHLLTKKEAARKHIPNDSALPTEEVLKKSEHARNIRTWLTKVD